MFQMAYFLKKELKSKALLLVPINPYKKLSVRKELKSKYFFY